MKKILVVAGIMLANFWAGALVLAGLILLESLRAIIIRRNASPFDRVRVTDARRERYELELQEAEFRVLNVGPTITPAVKR